MIKETEKKDIKDPKHLDDDVLSEQMLKMIERVSMHLLERSQKLGIKHDETSRLELGGVFFWLVRDTSKRTIKLGFTMSPRYWNFDAIHESLMLDEHEMYVSLGAVPYF